MKIQKPLVIVIALALAGGLAFSFGYKNISPVKNKKAIFACPAFDTTAVVVKMSDCGASNGSVVGLSAVGTGTMVYTWYNILGVRLSSGADLLHVPPGTYRVSLQDDSKCPAISLLYTVLENNPVTVDISNAVTASPSCNGLDGSITGLRVTNATGLQWTDENNKVVGTTKDLLNVGPGTYVFTASNTTGCLRQARFTVDAGTYAPRLASWYVTTSDCAASGQFHAVFDIKPNELAYEYTITDAAGKQYFAGHLGYNPKDSTRINIPQDFPVPYKYVNPFGGGGAPGYISPGLPVGTYTLTTIGDRCFTKLLTFTIKPSQMYIDTSNLHINTNVCGIKVGSITGLLLKGGPPAINLKFSTDPAQGWFWVNDKGVRVGGDSFLTDAPSGWYTVTAINYDHCAAPSLRFFLPDSISQASIPKVNDVKMCLPGIAALDVQNKDLKAHYRLYDSTQTLLDTSTAGYFARKVDVTTTFYIVSVNGICESPPVKITATVVNPGVTIPNAFTPNNDGINDYWDVTGLDHYPGTEITVFNRNGQRVYHSIDYSSPFNGQYNGKELPVGVYYYIVDTKKPDCRGGVSGSLTIIR